MSVAVLIGVGDNNIKIPAMVFASIEKGVEHCTKILGEPVKKYWTWEHHRWDVYGKQDKIKQFYTRYYDGCGGVDAFVLQEVEEGTPFVGWDLD